MDGAAFSLGDELPGAFASCGAGWESVTVVDSPSSAISSSARTGSSESGVCAPGFGGATAAGAAAEAKRPDKGTRAGLGFESSGAITAERAAPAADDATAADAVLGAFAEDALARDSAKLASGEEAALAAAADAVFAGAA